ncbi:MAG: M3 family metallopeptidase [Nitrososphaeraceae archaeon]
MNIEQWCKLDEIIYTMQSNEQYMQYAGFNYSENLMERLANMKLLNSEIFLDFFPEQQRTLFVGSLEDIAYSKTKKLELKLHNTRNKKIKSSKHLFNDVPVNWSTWRQFNSSEKNSVYRKEVFDEFIENTKHISPIIEKRFSTIKDIYQEHENTSKLDGKCRLSPVSGYLEDENISYEQIIDFIKSLGSKAKKPFKELVIDIGKNTIGKEPEYYDDFYFFRNKIYFTEEKNFVFIDPLNEIKKIFESLEFNFSKIHFDTNNRKNKYPSPICFFVNIPDDIRILYKRESPYFDLQGSFHETGHAMHAISIDKSNTYWDKYRIPMGIAEIFSIFFESLTKNYFYLKELLSNSNNHRYNDVINNIRSRNKFMELFFITFYTANSLMKLEYWKKNLSIDQANDLYAKLIKEYTGFEIPGKYWLLHHILPESTMYVPSYLLAAVRAVELENHIKDHFGDFWWKEKGTGNFLKEIIKPGAKINLSEFSKLNTNVLIDNIF